MGIVIKSQNVKHGYAATPPVPPERKEYVDSDFKGWDSEEYKCVTRNLNINTVYVLKRFTVTFVFDGSVVKVQTGVVYGTSATPPFIQPKEGYDVVWDDYSFITCNTTINGQYVRSSDYHVVTFIKTHPEGLSAEEVICEEFVKHGSDSNPPSLKVISGHTPLYDEEKWMFFGWDNDHRNIVRDTELRTRYTSTNHVLQLTCKEKSFERIKFFEFPITPELRVLKMFDKKGNYIPPFEELNKTDTHNKMILVQVFDCSVSSTNNIEELSDELFKQKNELEAVIFSNVKKTGTLSLYKGKSLYDVNFHSLEIAGVRSFKDNEKLTELVFPKLRIAEQGAFANCSNVKTIDMPELEIAYDDAFSYILMTRELHFPKLKKIYSGAFREMKTLNTFDAPELTEIEGAQVFTASALETLNIPNIEKISVSAFKGGGRVTSLLTELYFPKIKTIGKDGLYLFGESVIKMTLNSQCKENLMKEMGSTGVWGIGTYSTKKQQAFNRKGQEIEIIWK